MSDQAILPGFRRHVGYEKTPTWTDGRGNAVESPPWRPAGFYGQTVPVPLDKRGRELRIGPLRVLQRTDGRYLVYDERRALGCNALYLAQRGRGGLIEAIREMVRLARDEGLPVPVGPAPRGKGRRTNARGSGA